MYLKLMLYCFSHDFFMILTQTGCVDAEPVPCYIVKYPIFDRLEFSSYTCYLNQKYDVAIGA